jgi:transcriptional regulator with XRE-family HTH domain
MADDTPETPTDQLAAREADADPRHGPGLRRLRQAAGFDVAGFAERLGMTPEALAACEAGRARLPTAKLPRLAEACDAPLPIVVAALHGTGADTETAEIAALAQAFTRIPDDDQRTAVLQLALTLERDEPAPAGA